MLTVGGHPQSNPWPYESVRTQNNGLEVRIGVGVSEVLGVSVNGQGVSLGVGLGVGLVVVSPLSHLCRPSGSPSESWESYDFNHHLSS